MHCILVYCTNLLNYCLLLFYISLNILSCISYGGGTTEAREGLKTTLLLRGSPSVNQLTPQHSSSPTRLRWSNKISILLSLFRGAFKSSCVHAPLPPTPNFPLFASSRLQLGVSKIPQCTHGPQSQEDLGPFLSLGPVFMSKPRLSCCISYVQFCA